jgi:hypothetical protein
MIRGTSGNIRCTAKAGRGHLEHAEFTDGAEPVLDRSHDTVRMVLDDLKKQFPNYDGGGYEGPMHGCSIGRG